MLVIHDEQLTQQLQRIAEQENRPVEDVLRTLLAQYPSQNVQADVTERVRQVRRKAYAEARRYWQQSGDTGRLALTDTDLDEQFWLFDGEGIPRLKSDQGHVQLPEGSLRALTEEAAKARIRFRQTENPADYDDILNMEFADYLLQRSQSSDDSSNSD